MASARSYSSFMPSPPQRKCRKTVNCVIDAAPDCRRLDSARVVCGFAFDPLCVAQTSVQWLMQDAVAARKKSGSNDARHLIDIASFFLNHTLTARNLHSPLTSTKTAACPHCCSLWRPHPGSSTALRGLPGSVLGDAIPGASRPSIALVRGRSVRTANTPSCALSGASISLTKQKRTIDVVSGAFRNSSPRWWMPASPKSSCPPATR